VKGRRAGGEGGRKEPDGGGRGGLEAEIKVRAVGVSKNLWKREGEELEDLGVGEEVGKQSTEKKQEGVRGLGQEGATPSVWMSRKKRRCKGSVGEERARNVEKGGRAKDEKRGRAGVGPVRRRNVLIKEVWPEDLERP